jgi:hypothetical protein
MVLYDIDDNGYYTPTLTSDMISSIFDVYTAKYAGVDGYDIKDTSSYTYKILNLLATTDVSDADTNILVYEILYNLYKGTMTIQEIVNYLVENNLDITIANLKGFISYFTDGDMIKYKKLVASKFFLDYLNRSYLLTKKDSLVDNYINILRSVNDNKDKTISDIHSKIHYNNRNAWLLKPKYNKYDYTKNYNLLNIREAKEKYFDNITTTSKTYTYSPLTEMANILFYKQPYDSFTNSTQPILEPVFLKDKNKLYYYQNSNYNDLFIKIMNQSYLDLDSTKYWAGVSDLGNYLYDYIKEHNAKTNTELYKIGTEITDVEVQYYDLLFRLFNISDTSLSASLSELKKQFSNLQDEYQAKLKSIVTYDITNLSNNISNDDLKNILDNRVKEILSIAKDKSKAINNFDLILFYKTISNSSELESEYTIIKSDIDNFYTDAKTIYTNELTSTYFEAM